MSKNFYNQLEKMYEGDSRYKPEAYEFVMQALFYTQKKLKRDGHINAQELLNGIKDFALEQFGPMAHTVFEHWGITSTDDLGNIVFKMIENGLLKKTEGDSPEDFRAVYDLKETFKTSYRTKLEREIREVK
jgi:uncharacterized repeat protein (TIGR04138 family)